MEVVVVHLNVLRQSMPPQKYEALIGKAIRNETTADRAGTRCATEKPSLETCEEIGISDERIVALNKPPGKGAASPQRRQRMPRSRL